MIIKSIFLAILASVFAATFSIGDSVITRDLQSALYENRLAVVVNNPTQNEQGETLYPVIFWMGLKNPDGPFSGTKNLGP
jgi:hypothetical protein